MPQSALHRTLPPAIFPGPICVLGPNPLDAHLSPTLAKWISTQIGHPAQSVRDLGLRTAKDKDIFAAARQASAIVMTKVDYAEMVERLGPPPRES